MFPRTPETHRSYRMPQEYHKASKEPIKLTSVQVDPPICTLNTFLGRLEPTQESISKELEQAPLAALWVFSGLSFSLTCFFLAASTTLYPYGVKQSCNSSSPRLSWTFKVFKARYSDTSPKYNKLKVFGAHTNFETDDLSDQPNHFGKKTQRASTRSFLCVAQYACTVIQEGSDKTSMYLRRSVQP